MTPQAPSAPRPVAAQTRMPAGVKMSTVWRRTDGQLVEAAARPDGTRPELPVDADWRPVGALWMCQNDNCPTVVWVFDPVATARPEQEFCARDGRQIVPAPVNPDDPDPIRGASVRKAHRLAAMYAERRRRVAETWNLKADELKKAAAAAGRRTVRDFRGHTPSALTSTAGLLAGWWLHSEGGAVVAAATGVALSTFGAVVAYVAVYVAERMRVARTGDDVVGRVARRLRARARHVASGVLALGCWLLSAAVAGADLGTWGGTFCLLLGVALIWAVNRQHWDKLWEDRRRLAELARLRAEEAARRAAEAAKQVEEVPSAPAVAWDDVLEVGKHYAALWQRIARSDTVPAGFAMRRTWIEPEKTRELTAPAPDGSVRRIGHEFVIRCEPGALAARFGSESPLVSARKWLADMLDGPDGTPGRDLATVELVDRPSGQPNTGLLILTDGVALGGVVEWKGKAGVRIDPDGSRWGHRGRSLQGEDVQEATYIPGQNTGGLVIGRRGGGKSVDTRRRLLNWLVTGVLPVLFDPKQFVDYGDFAGVFPMGCTQEHRDVITESLHAERQRRERWMTQKPLVDKWGRERPGESLWDTADGPPVNHAWEEFHDLSADDEWLQRFTNHVRFERAAAMNALLITQGGGLADLGDSVLRSLINQIELTTFRIDEHQARLGGAREMAYSPADLPQLPGMCLVMAPEVPPIPVRTAFIHRKVDEDGSVFDHLWGPNMEPLLPAPALHEETVATWERTGLMDLWRTGQGPGGLRRLQTSTNTPDGPMPTAQIVAGQKVEAADMILAIAASKPSCDRAFVEGHRVWMSAPGWGKKPSQSTISRAALRLVRDGLLSKTDDGEDFRVLPAGEARAAAAMAAVGLALSEADAERAAEAAAEEVPA